jgi:hypothetical protein
MPRGVSRSMKMVGLCSMARPAIEAPGARSPALCGPRPALYWRGGIENFRRGPRLPERSYTVPSGYVGGSGSDMLLTLRMPSAYVFGETPGSDTAVGGRCPPCGGLGDPVQQLGLMSDRDRAGGTGRAGRSKAGTRLADGFMHVLLIYHSRNRKSRCILTGTGRAKLLAKSAQTSARFASFWA